MYKYPNRVPFYKFLFKSTAISKNPIPFHKRFFQEHKDSFSVKAPFNDYIMLTCNAEISKHILQKKHKVYHKSKIQTTYLSKYVGYGLLTSNGDYWLKQRRLIQPAFHKEKIKNLLGIINSTIEEQISQIKTDEFVQIYPILNTLAFEVVAKSLFNFSAEKKTLKRLQFIVEKLQLFIVKEIRQPHKRVLYTLNGEIKYHNKLVQESRQIINTIIDERKKSEDTHDDLLDMLLSAEYEDGSKMSNTQLIDEILIIFVAGHETTANALSFTLFLLANNKVCLEKVTSEIEASKKEDSLLNKIKTLKYTSLCIDESLRLYPPAWITDRVALQDDSFGDFHIKKGTIIGISIYELHRNKLYWEQPEAFIPERFNTMEKKQLSECYMPFGAGPRFCIGNNFAIYEMILAISKLLESFTIEAKTDVINVNPLITLKPVGLELKFRKKNA